MLKQVSKAISLPLLVATVTFCILGQTSADVFDIDEARHLKFRPELKQASRIFKEQLQKVIKAPVGNLRSCMCQAMTCSCCVKVELHEKIDLDVTGCISVSYLPKEIGMELKLTLDGITIIDEKVSASNPPPICAAIPYVHKLASVCLKFGDMHIDRSHFTGCSWLEVEFADMEIGNFKLGCFNIPLPEENLDHI